MCTIKVCYLLLVSVFVLTLGGPNSEMTEKEFINLVFSVEKLEEILKAYSQYRQFLPFYVLEPLDNITNEQKIQIVQMVNDYHAGKFEPKNSDEIIAILKKSYPAIDGPYEKSYGKYKEQVAKLGPKGQEYANKFEAQMYADASPDRIIWACHIFNNGKQAVKEAKRLLQDDSEAEKIEQAFPEAVNLLNSKEFDAYSIVVSNLKELDCDKDRQQVFNTIKLLDTHSVLTTN